ncbi:hypothetical protein ACFY8W_18615 [Streptomyces sp. NPDC012637]|uniref:hypothetical protein n=1 Tax=Streptomyces sp. NPDC012637 TaxID=3364842 RepID=UPI0036EDB7FF
MVSSPHETMHRIFQHDPHLFSRLSDVLGIPLPATVEAVVLTTGATGRRPVERRVDTLPRRNSTGDGSLLLAIAAQHEKDPAKPATWAYDTAYLWTTYGMPTALLVVCQDRATAEWAGQAVPAGPASMPNLTIQPIVVGPHNMPVITDPAEARADLAVATLAAIAHARDPDIGAVLRALSTALREVPENVADPIVECVAQGLGDRPAMETWRNLVASDLSFYTSYLSEQIRDEGRAQGLAEAVLTVLWQRRLHVSDDARRRITACDDPEVLRHWIARAVIAYYAEEIYADADRDG